MAVAEYLGFGASSKQLCDVDLLFDRLFHAHQKLLGSSFLNADGQSLPFPSGAFDLVLQYTAISSVLDSDIRRNICADILRVLKHDGVIIWYDFWLNPTNPQTKGIRKKEIREIFPNCDYEFHKITLAPPLARKLVPISWIFAQVLEKNRNI